MVTADHRDRERSESLYRSHKKHYEYSDRKGQERKEDKGNKATGQTAVWLFVAANLTVAISVTIKGMSGYIPQR
jgi:hypothetical protein